MTGGAAPNGHTGCLSKNSEGIASSGMVPAGQTPAPGPCSAGADIFIMNSSIWLRNLALREISASCVQVSDV